MGKIIEVRVEKIEEIGGGREGGWGKEIGKGLEREGESGSKRDGRQTDKE